MNSPLALPPDLARAVAAERAPNLTIAAPLNDVQLIAWIAALIMGDRHREAHQCVADAISIVGESFVQFQTGALAKAIDRARQRLGTNTPAGSPQ